MSLQSQISKKIKGGKKQLEDCSISELRKMARFHHIVVSVGGKYLTRQELINTIKEKVQIKE